MEKKSYETPEVTKVEIDFSDRIIAAGCVQNDPATTSNPCTYNTSWWLTS